VLKNPDALGLFSEKSTRETFDKVIHLLQALNSAFKGQRIHLKKHVQRLSCDTVNAKRAAVDEALSHF